MGNQFVSVSVVARRLDRTERTVRYWCEAGVIPGAFQVAARKQWRIPLAWLLRISEITAKTE